MPTESTADEYRRTSQAFWQKMATNWEQHDGVIREATRPVSEWLVAQVDPQPGQTLLDLAAGAGETGFLAVERLGPDGRLISSDFAPNMVEVAQKRAAERGIVNADFRVLDAEQLALEDMSVDAVVCRFGYMLVADPALALRETRRVLRTGGRLAFSVWAGPQHNPWMTIPGSVMVQRGHMPPPAAPDAAATPGMFSLGDPQRITTLVEQAGFAPAIEQLPITLHFADADELWAFVSQAQGAIALLIAKLDEQERGIIRAAIEERAADFLVDGAYALPGMSLNVSAS